MAKARTTTIPKEHSIWIRPMRLLLDGGHPIGPVSMFWLKEVDSTGSFPFCAVTYTKDHRLVAWPALPANPGVSNIDHVTLEFPSLEMHVTHFTSSGIRKAARQSWRAQTLLDDNVSLWFNFIIRKSVISDQERKVERVLKSPTVDVERRKNEFVRYAQAMRQIEVSLPPDSTDGDYVIGSLFLHLNPAKSPRISARNFPSDGRADKNIDGWPDGTFGIALTGTHIGPIHLLIAIASPPGRARTDVVIGLPKSPQLQH